jgi:hypothetical protein
MYVVRIMLGLRKPVTSRRLSRFAVLLFVSLDSVEKL